jgi:hypothetical protein
MNNALRSAQNACRCVAFKRAGLVCELLFDLFGTCCTVLMYTGEIHWYWVLFRCEASSASHGHGQQAAPSVTAGRCPCVCEEPEIKSSHTGDDHERRCLK